MRETLEFKAGRGVMKGGRRKGTSVRLDGTDQEKRSRDVEGSFGGNQIQMKNAGRTYSSSGKGTREEKGGESLGQGEGRTRD